MGNARVAIITGGAGDIGKSIATRIAGCVDHVALVDRDEDRLSEAVELLGGSIAQLSRWSVDVRSRQAIRASVADITTRIGPVSVLVNVAGCPALYSPVVETTDESIDEIIESHLRGTITFCQAALTSMLARNNGRIINIVSVAAFQGPPGGATYAAAKAGIVGFTRSLAAEVGEHGITANCISPGFTASRRVVGNFDEEGRRQHLEELGVRIKPLRMATTDEIGAAAKYLCSEDAAYVTGTVMHVNGGAFRP